MDYLVIQQFQNEPIGRLVNLYPSELDKSNSLLETFPQKKEVISKDKYTMGYTSQGLPFLVVSRRLDESEDLAFNFIDQHVLPQLYDIAQRLSVSDNSREVVIKFIESIDQLRNDHAPNAEFTLCVAVVYEKADDYRCSGFSIGKHGIVLKNIDGLSQMAYGTEVCKADEDWVTDKFGTRQENDASLADMIHRNCIFTDIIVEKGNELHGYTTLFPELSDIKVAQDARLKTRRIYMNFAQVPAENKRQLWDYFRMLGINQGSDITIGNMCIPTQDLRCQLSREVALADAQKFNEKSIDEIRQTLVNTIASSQLRIHLPRKHGYTLFSVGITIFFHTERVDSLLEAVKMLPSRKACLTILQHQQSFYDPDCALPRPPLPAWVDHNCRDRLEQAFKRSAHKGFRGYWSLLELLTEILDGIYEDELREATESSVGIMLAQNSNN